MGFLKEAWTPGPRAAGARRALQVLFVGVAGLFLFRFGLPGMILGGAWVAGGADVTAKLDSETRFLSAIALGIGVAALWLVRNFEKHPGVGVFIGTFALLGGLMRVVSIALYGVPAADAVVATALEILLPVAVVLILSRRAPTGSPVGG